jgi:hypothetical protein
MRRGAIAIFVAAAVALLVPATAAADFQTLYDDYRGDGIIDGCAYPIGELSSGLSGMPADIREYDPGFSDALNTALEQAASGCKATPAKMAKNQAIAADRSPGPVRPRPAALNVTVEGRGMPAVLIALLAVLGAALAVAALLYVAYLYGWDLRGRLRLRGP